MRNSKGQFIKGFKPWNAGTATKLICENCNGIFIPQNYNHQQQFCSRKCQALANSGENNPMYKKPTYGFKERHHTEETRGRLSKNHKGNIPWNKGKKYPQYSGKNNPAWKGGVSSQYEKIRHSEEYNQWRLLVYKRDDHTCQDCGHRFIDIVAHHIKSFADFEALRFDVNNGKVLCKSCHSKLHKKRN